MFIERMVYKIHFVRYYEIDFKELLNVLSKHTTGYCNSLNIYFLTFIIVFPN